MTEPKEPYYSSRVHITEPTAAKVLGIKTRSIEVTFGNQDSVTIRNKEDISDVIDNVDIAKKVWDLWEQVTAQGHFNGHKFVEDITTTEHKREIKKTVPGRSYERLLGEDMEK